MPSKRLVSKLVVRVGGAANPNLKIVIDSRKHYRNMFQRTRNALTRFNFVQLRLKRVRGTLRTCRLENGDHDIRSSIRLYHLG